MKKKPKWAIEYNCKVGTIKYRYDLERDEVIPKLVGHKRGVQVQLGDSILIILRDLLRAHADGLTGCPYGYTEKYGDVEMGCDAWAEEILSVADMCDDCLEDTFHKSERLGIDEEKVIEDREKTLGKIMDWLKENLDTLWW